MPFREPYRANEFVVEIGAVESPTVTKVSGLSLGTTETVEVVEGGTNVVHKVSNGVVKFESVTIERLMDGGPDDLAFKSYFESMFKLGNGNQGGSNVRRDGAVVKKHNGKEVFRVNFYSAWVKSAHLSDLEAGSNALMKQTIVIEHEGLEYIPVF